MKIKITNYPFEEYQIGDICDFGPEKNSSLVSLQRAVFLDNPPFILIKKPELILHDVAETINPEPKPELPKPPTKKLIKNELREKIQQNKSESTSPDKPDKKSFWDRLK